jgi:hypothetical protein
MKTLTLQVEPEIAKRILSEFERQISEKIRSRDALSQEINKLEESAKTLRAQLQGGNGAGSRQPHGANKTRILEYLTHLPDGKGARMIEISRATGISASSTAFTLRKNPKSFVQEARLWRLNK